MARVSILVGFVGVVALGCIINEAIARDVKLMRLPKIKHEALRMSGRDEGKFDQGEIETKLSKAIETARHKLNDLKTLRASSDMRGDRLDFLIESEVLLKEMSTSLKNRTFSKTRISVFIEKESSFYEAWKEKSYNTVVTEKEKEFMSKMGHIMVLLKQAQKKM